MESQLVSTLIKVWGAYGVILVVLASVIVMLWRHTIKQQNQLIELQNLRVTEAKEVRTELMAYSQKSNEVVNNLTMVVSSLKEAIQLMNLQRDSRSPR